MTENMTAADAAPDSDSTPASIESWTELGVKAEIEQALADLGYLRPMPVQSAVFRHLSDGKDMMVQAKTGTGKTAAFGIPIVNGLDEERREAQALILTPTRELALQVAAELGSIAKYRQVSVVPVYGGAPIKKQIDALADGAQIVVGTPGRVLDHMRRKTLVCKGLKMLCLDECDEMLSMGFQEEIEAIIERMPGKEERQTLLFSATIPSAIERIASKHLTDPERIQLTEGGISVDEIDHGYYIVSGMARLRDLLKVIAAEDPESAIIFCNTRDETATVAKYLNRHGYDAESLSSDLSQRDRERVMGRMKQKNLRFLVATDIAARGIDISDLPYVINYTFPESAEVYVHRTGRTGRAGNRGIALSLIGPREIGAFYYLKLLYKIQPEEREIPGEESIAALLDGEKLAKLISGVRENPGDDYIALAKRLIASPDAERVVGALLKRLKEGELAAAKARVAAKAAAPRRDEVEADAEETERPGRERRPRRRRDRSADTEPRAEEVVSSRAATEQSVKDDGEEAAPKKRRRRRRRDSSEKTASAAETSPPTSDDSKGAAKAETAGSADSKDDENAEKPARARAKSSDKADASSSAKDEPKRKRRSRKSPAKDSAKSSRSDDGKEFWETWADERTNGEEVAEGDGEPANDDAATVRLYVNVGKREEVTADDVRELLAEGLADGVAEQIGRIAVRNTHCYVRVAEDAAEEVIAGAAGKVFKERDLVVERARA